MPAYSFSSILHKKYVTWWQFTKNGIFAKTILNVLKKVWSDTKHVKQVNGASYWCIYH